MNGPTFRKGPINPFVGVFKIRGSGVPWQNSPRQVLCDSVCVCVLVSSVTAINIISYFWASDVLLAMHPCGGKGQH